MLAVEALVAILALVLIFNGALALRRALGCRRWPSTVGVIARAVPTAPVTFSDWFNQAVLGRARAKAGDTSAQPLRLCYVYALEGFKYIGCRLNASPAWPWARNALEGLQEGEKVRVFYHPKYPHIAFLAQSYAWPALSQVAVGAALLAATFGF